MPSISLPAFTSAVHRIIREELDAVQQEQYTIEGQEMIASLFADNQLPVYDEANGLVFDFGIAPSAIEIQAAGISFVDVINSCFHLVTADGSRSWTEVLREQHTHPLLVELLCEKYPDLLTEIPSSL